MFSRKRLILSLTGASATAAILVVLLATGSGAATARQRVAGTLLRVTERDFHIAPSATTVPAGAVTLRIHNAGPDQHELIILPLHRGEQPGGLPLRADGFTVNEELLQSQEPGSINPQEPGHTEELVVHLAPGRYVLFCNMEGHYMAGMHRLLVVTG